MAFSTNFTRVISSRSYWLGVSSARLMWLNIFLPHHLTHSQTHLLSSELYQHADHNTLTLPWQSTWERKRAVELAAIFPQCPGKSPSTPTPVCCHSGEREEHFNNGECHENCLKKCVCHIWPKNIFLFRKKKKKKRGGGWSILGSLQNVALWHYFH